MKTVNSVVDVLEAFLSHLSGDEGNIHAMIANCTFLSHLSGDEVPIMVQAADDAFLSHLSGDEVV